MDSADKAATALDVLMAGQDAEELGRQTLNGTLMQGTIQSDASTAVKATNLAVTLNDAKSSVDSKQASPSDEQ